MNIVSDHARDVFKNPDDYHCSHSSSSHNKTCGSHSDESSEPESKVQSAQKSPVLKNKAAASKAMMTVFKLGLN